MLILTWRFMCSTVIPKLGVILSTLVDGVMPIVIMCAGISVLLSIVSIRTGGFWSAIGHGASRGLGFIGRTIVSAIGWCLRHFFMFIPVFYVGIRNSFRRSGSGEFIANFISLIATILFIVVII